MSTEIKKKGSICMSYLNNNNKDIRCNKKAIYGDFCGYHKKSKKYMKKLIDDIGPKEIDKVRNTQNKLVDDVAHLENSTNSKKLDEENIETLLGLYDTW